MFFTDPSYGFEQGFRPRPQQGEYVWAFDPSDGTTWVAAEGFVKPNGLAFSPDGKKIYISGVFSGMVHIVCMYVVLRGGTLL